MKLVFSDEAWEDYLHWQDLHWQGHDANVLERLNALIDQCRRSPFTGAGKPEPLKGDLAGWCSRRITLQDRLVYRVSGKAAEQALEIAQCRFHY